MKKSILKLLCSALALLMLIPALFSCGGTEAKESDTEQTLVITPPEEEKLVLPEDHMFEGETFHILSAGNQVCNDFKYKDETGTVLDQAQYKRNQTILQENGVSIELKMVVDKNSLGAGAGFQEINRVVTAEDVVYHLGLIAGYDVASLASSACLYDINSIPWVETSKSWWDQNANNDLSINGMLFFTNGSLTVAYSESTFVIYINKKLAKEGLPNIDIYQTVRDGKWTVDELSRWTKTISKDLDGDGQQTYKDRFGLYVWDDSILGMMGSSGTKVATIGDDGSISLTLNTSNALNMFNKYAEIAYDEEYSLIYQRYNHMFSELESFKNDQALMWATSNGKTPFFRDMDADFGILPYPKLTEDQDRYYSTISPYNSQFLCVPYMEDEQTISFIGVITESLAYYGKTVVWPACYELTLKGAFARDEGTMDMLDIIYGSYIYDIGYYFTVGDYHRGLLNLIRQKSKNFSSMYETSRNAAETEITQLNDSFKDALNDWGIE